MLSVTRRTDQNVGVKVLLVLDSGDNGSGSLFLLDGLLLLRLGAMGGVVMISSRLSWWGSSQFVDLFFQESI